MIFCFIFNYQHKTKEHNMEHNNKLVPLFKNIIIGTFQTLRLAKAHAKRHFPNMQTVIVKDGSNYILMIK
jgi:hypothetical protein